MLHQSDQELTDEAVAAMAGVGDVELRWLLQRAVRGLHDLVRTLRPTSEEFHALLDFLREAGQACDDRHNELILLADVLGLSTLVLMVNEGGGSDGALLGPFYRDGAPRCANGDSIARPGTPGDPLLFEGLVTDPDGTPLADVAVDVWQASPHGLYDNQGPEPDLHNLRGGFVTGADGRFWFASVRPAGYPVPTHGPTGRLLALAGRAPMRPAHLHFLFHKPGWRTLVTQYFLDEDSALASDVVFGARRSLVGELVPARPPGTGWVARGRFRLCAGQASRPKAPIK